MIELKRRHLILGVALIILIGVGSYAILNRPVDNEATSMNVNDYGTLVLTSGDTIVGSLDIILAAGGLVVEYTSTVSVGELMAQLYTDSGVFVEDGVRTTLSTYIHTFSFTLDGAPAGLNKLYVAFGGAYSAGYTWVGSSIYFFVQQDVVPSYPALQFTVTPSDKRVNISELCNFGWTIIYTGPATARITVDGVTKTSRALVQTNQPQQISYATSFSAAGTYKVKLIVEPEYDIASADEVIVTVVSPVSSTTTTTVTTGTTSTTATATTATTTMIVRTDWTSIGIQVLLLVGIIVTIAWLQLRSRE